MFNGKRGQGVLPSSAAGWLVTLIVVVILIFGATNLLGGASDVVDAANPGDLQRVVSACETVHSTLPLSYCLGVRELGDNFVTCGHSTVHSLVEGDKPDCTVDVSEDSVTASLEEFCRTTNSIKESDWNRVTVNDRTCESIVGAFATRNAAAAVTP